MVEREKYLPYLSSTSAAVIFGFSFLFTKEALTEIDPFHLLGLRFGMAAILLLVLKAFNVIEVDYKEKNVKRLIPIAFVQPAAYFTFEIFGVKLTTSSEAGMMIAIIPVIVTILAVVFLKEMPSKVQVLFIGISVSGAVFIIVMKSNEIGSSVSGLMILLLAVLCASASNILSRKLSVVFNPLEITFVMMCCGAIFFNGIAILQHLIKGDMLYYFEPLLNIKVVSAVLYLGVLSSVLAFFLSHYTLSKIEASRSAVFANLSSVVSILAGVLIRHEAFYWYQMVGAVMILSGVWGTNYFGSKKIENVYNNDKLYKDDKVAGIIIKNNVK